MNSYRKLFNNSIIFSIGNFTSKFIALLMLPFYTNILSQSEFGQADLIVTTITLLVPILTVNIIEAIVRFGLDKKNYSLHQVLTNSTMFILFGFILLLSSFPILLKINFLNNYLILFYLLFIVVALRTSVKQFARTIDLNKVYMTSDILYSIVFVLGNFVFLYFVNSGVKGYLVSMIIAYLIDLFYLTGKTRAINFISVKHLDIQSIKGMFLYSLPLMPNAVMWWIMDISDRYMITYYSGLNAVGLYAVANRFPGLLNNFYSFFYKAWQISAIEEYNDDNRDEFYTNVFTAVFFALTLFASMFLLFNKIITNIFVSKAFFEVWRITPFLIIGAVFSCLSGFLGTNYQASKHTIGVLYSSLAGAIINISFNFLLIPNFGAYGAAFSTMVSFFFVWVIRIIDTKKYVKIYYPKYQMIIILLLLSIQISLGYLNLSTVISIVINISVISVIIFLSYRYFEAQLSNFVKTILYKIKN